MSLLTLRSVKKTYADQTVLQDISFQLDRGDRLCLIGNNGAGKTTLLRLIMGLENPDEGQITIAGGTVCGYLPQELDQAGAERDTDWISPEIRGLEQAMRQAEQKMASLGNRPEGDPELRAALASYAELHSRFEALGGYAHRHLMEEALAGLGLQGDVLLRPLATMSGGERMRVALARLIIRNPDLLLLDEPTNHLDLTALEWLETYLARFKGTVLTISHDRTFIDRTATAVGELAGGNICIRPGGYTRFMELSAADDLTRKREINKVTLALQHEEAVAQTMLSHRKMSAYHAREKSAQRLSSRLNDLIGNAHKKQQRLSFRFLPGLNSGDPDRVLLDVRGLTGGYGGEPLFQQVSFTLRARGKTCLCGPNGCGKTTLLNFLRGERVAAEGQVRLADQMQIGHLGQHVVFDDESKSALEELLSHSILSEGAARDLLARYGFRDTQVFKQLSVLSGGERSRLYLACLLLEEPNILFLDEPTNHLDIYSREILEQALLAFDGAILAVSHDRMFIDHCCDRVLGFIGSSVKAYPTFSAYRRAARQAEEQASQPQPFSVQNDTRIRRDGQNKANRVEERRETALRKEKLRAVESTIEAKEQAKADFEATVSSATQPDEYESYAVLLAELEQLYVEYGDLLHQLDL